jgi:NADPH:quinone reductase-like Zn-dependent oxidoreductase
MFEVRAAGVGNWDDIVRAGDWDVGRTPPMALGVNVAGVVAAPAPDVERWSVGTRCSRTRRRLPTRAA